MSVFSYKNEVYKYLWSEPQSNISRVKKSDKKLLEQMKTVTLLYFCYGLKEERMGEAVKIIKINVRILTLYD